TNFDFVGLGPIVSYDPRAVISAGLLDLTANDDDDVITKSWQVEEEVNTFYAMLNVDAELGEMPLTGNIGVQFVNAEQSSTGGIADEANAGSFVLTTEEGSTDEVLPSLNLSLEVMDGLYARVSVARTLARPRMDDLRVSRTLNRDDRYLTVTNPVVGQAYFTADGGNPQLQPYTADGFDLSIEKFFGDGGYVAAAVFHKSIGNWAFDATRPADFSAFTSLVPADQLPGLGSTTGFLSAPINVSGGSIEGLELSAQVPFETFADALEGFGVNVSASFTDSEITPNPAAGPISVPGLSETVVNTTAYYENNGFGVRVSNRYRSDFLGEVSGFGFDRTLRTVEEESLWDAQLTLDLGEMSFAPEYLDGLSFFLQGINLTDEPFRTFNGGDSRQVIDHQEYGSTYLVGFSYTFD
ncbi:MAG: TonB-dependent receptor, partial [Pseudomonadota bacterium]